MYTYIYYNFKNNKNNTNNNNIYICTCMYISMLHANLSSDTTYVSTYRELINKYSSHVVFIGSIGQAFDLLKTHFGEGAFWTGAFDKITVEKTNK